MELERSGSKRARQPERFLTQPFYVTGQFTGQAGKTVELGPGSRGLRADPRRRAGRPARAGALQGRRCRGGRGRRERPGRRRRRRGGQVMKLEVLIPTGPVLEAEVDKLVAEAANGSFCVKPRQELAYAFEHCLLLGNGLCFHSFTSFNGSKCRSRAPPATGIVLASQRIQRTQGGHVPRTDLEDIEVSRLTGKQVLTQDGREIGDLRTMCLDLSSWRVTSVRVRLRRALLEELTLDRPLVGTQRVTIPVDAISGITDAIVLRSTMPELVELLQREGATSEPDEDQDAEDEETGAGTD